METTLAILMVLGIFVGVPALIGLAIAEGYVLAGHKAQKAEQKAETAVKANVLTA